MKPNKTCVERYQTGEHPNLKHGWLSTYKIKVDMLLYLCRLWENLFAGNLKCCSCMHLAWLDFCNKHGHTIIGKNSKQRRKLEEQAIEVPEQPISLSNRWVKPLFTCQTYPFFYFLVYIQQMGKIQQSVLSR